MVLGPIKKEHVMLHVALHDPQQKGNLLGIFSTRLFCFKYSFSDKNQDILNDWQWLSQMRV